jgi:carbon-monoxide dehydrogenase small subunit
MVAAGALASDPTIGDDPERVNGLVGSNVCRCTGYEPIRRAIMRAAKEQRETAT